MSSAVVVKMPEALDARSARRLGRELKNKIACESPLVVLDLSRVKDIDVPGLEGLLKCMQQVAHQDGSLQLSGVGPAIATLLELTRISQLMQKFPGFSIEAPQFEVAPETEDVTAENAAQLPIAA